MSAARNKVIAGDYAGWDVVVGGRQLSFMKRLSRIVLDKTTVDRYEVVDAQSGNSFWGNFLRGYAASAFLGSAGLVASAVSGQGKRAILVSVEFTGGARSLIEVDDAHFKKIVQILY